jgi:hypothetical protein
MQNCLAECSACCLITVTMLHPGFMSAGRLCFDWFFQPLSSFFMVTTNSSAVAKMKWTCCLEKVSAVNPVQLQIHRYSFKARAVSQIIARTLVFCTSRWNTPLLLLLQGILLSPTTAEYVLSFWAVAIMTEHQGGAQILHLKSSA